MKMFIVLLSMLPLLALIINVIRVKLSKKNPIAGKEVNKYSLKTTIILVVVSVVLFLVQIGTYYINSNSSGHKQLNLGSNLNPGQIVAESGQKGYQSDIDMPGWHYDIRYPWFLSISEVEDLVVPPKHVAILIAKDGLMNPNEIAPKWTFEKDGKTPIDPLKMITDFKYFKDNYGTRGVQQYELTTGTYKINRYLWNVEIKPMIEIESGSVLVVESKFGKAPAFTKTSDDEILSVPLVADESFRGIVNSAYPPGLYGLNPYTQKGHIVPINLITFSYKGGYTSKIMDISIDPENDKLKVNPSESKIPEGGHGPAFSPKTKDNHTVHIGVRVLGQVEPVQAPRFVGTIKDTEKLDDKIIEPYTKNVLENIIVKYTALELKNKREEIGKEIAEALRSRTTSIGFRVKTVEIVDLDIPPIVLISGKIQSTSIQLKQALIEKEKTVRQAIQVQNLQEQANQQGVVAKAKVEMESAKMKEIEIKTIADANYYKAVKEADSKNYDIKETAKANNFSIKQKADAAKYLAEQVGKKVVGEMMIQDKINEGAEKMKVPETYTYVNTSGKSDGDNGVTSATILSNAMRSSLKTRTQE